MLRLVLALLPAPALAASSDAAGSCSTRVSGHAAGEHAVGVGPSVQLAWQLRHPARGVRQRAVELELEGLAPHGGGLRWRSGAVEGARQHADTAALAPELRLPSGAVIRFRVRATVSVGDTGATTSVVCEGTFETAPATPAFPGPAKWIGGGGQLHAKQGLALPPGTVAHARAYASGVGAFYLYLNGEQVGENIMDPPQSVYSKRMLYQTFDIGALLKPGRNSVDALLGNYKWGCARRHNPPGALRPLSP